MQTKDDLFKQLEKIVRLSQDINALLVNTKEPAYTCMMAQLVGTAWAMLRLNNEQESTYKFSRDNYLAMCEQAWDYARALETSRLEVQEAKKNEN